MVSAAVAVELQLVGSSWTMTLGPSSFKQKQTLQRLKSITEKGIKYLNRVPQQQRNNGRKHFSYFSYQIYWECISVQILVHAKKIKTCRCI